MIDKIKNLSELEKRRLLALIGAFLMYVIVTLVFVYLVDKRIILSTLLINQLHVIGDITIIVVMYYITL